jgi:hypothetical protein
MRRRLRVEQSLKTSLTWKPAEALDVRARGTTVFLSMVYVGIVAAEFVVATIGVALLIRHYNHKA